MTIDQYLETETRRYFPTATRVWVEHYNDETITIFVDDVRWSMEIGSDDDRFAFYTDDDASVFTIPFQPEEI